MQTITLVTGNKNKLAEWQRLFPAHIKLESEGLDLPEIQSLDIDEIVIDKAKRAFKLLKRPVLVEDVAAGLDDLGGLPGPFIKFFEQQLGYDALYKLGGDQARCTLTTAVAYYDGERSLVGKGVLHGHVVARRGDVGFGFDFVFVPDGMTQTFAEMGPGEKDRISHRMLAINDLLQQLTANEPA